MAIKPRGFGLVATVLAISGVMRVAGPVSVLPRQASVTDTKKKSSRTAGTKISIYRSDFLRVILEFFQVSIKDPNQVNGAADTWDLPADRQYIRYVIAVLPDPVHTHLGLLFDRSVEARQQAAQRKGYVFDRAILPWDRTLRDLPTELDKRQKEIEEQVDRESYPGLLIFREGLGIQQKYEYAQCLGCFALDSGKAPPEHHPEPLFVLIVGETPTGGVRTQQLVKAADIIEKIRGPLTDRNKPVLVLGPSFSGSLTSLKEQFSKVAQLRSTAGTYVYSGMVTDAQSMSSFLEANRDPAHTLHFASFQENDDYIRGQFVQFACANNYPPSQIAILSEDETVFGSQSSTSPTDSGLNACDTHQFKGQGLDDVVQLHFPREISYFRSAYQKETAAQLPPDTKLPGASTLHIDLEESRNNDDSVQPYSGAQMPPSQEAVMLGIASELQKHHVKFTLLYATDPVDELFLARYLRTRYPEGRVVVTAPDLLLAREEGGLLHGVLGISAYALVPGLSDRLCQSEGSGGTDKDRLFVSSLSVGTFNAMVALLSVQDAKTKLSASLPPGPYAGYATPVLDQSSKDNLSCQSKPLLWMTILGRDGFWPVVGIAPEGVTAKGWLEPIDYFLAAARPTLRPAGQSVPPQGHATGKAKYGVAVPAAWEIAYCLCLLLMVLHIVLTWSGSILAEAEARAQFSRSLDWRGVSVVALGSLVLAAIFVTLMFTRAPLEVWNGNLSNPLWLPFLVFVPATLFDLAWLRRQPTVAIAFLLSLLLTIGWHVIAWIPRETICSSGSVWSAAYCGVPRFQAWTEHQRLNFYWSSRLLHLTSGLSPILPVLLLLACGYWWMWQSLRGLLLVDLRRPRLPSAKDLIDVPYPITEHEAEDLRLAAHPFVFTWWVWLCIVLVIVGTAITVMDRRHPVQTIEGKAYDWGYFLLLAVTIAMFLGCLLKLAATWFKCRQILTGLDRLPLREAFSRMKRVSWQSLWNPGGNTLRETFRLMSRAVENLTRLRSQMQDWSAPISDAARRKAIDQMGKIERTRGEMWEISGRLGCRRNNQPTADGGSSQKARFGFAEMIAKTSAFPSSIAAGIMARHRNANQRRNDLKLWMDKMKDLQEEMARMTACLISRVLAPMWNEEAAPIVSEDERFAKVKITPIQALAEEYAALTYVNFLVTVLLRMRVYVICAIGMYVFIVLSMNVYPFEPHAALQTLAIVLLVAMGVIVAFVYAEMHREAVLSRLTSKEAGELGWDFWVKLLSAGAIPIFSLLAVQFPSISQFFFSWLEPALQVAK
jgi:hypothetical protein